MNKPATLSEWKEFFNKWEQSGMTRKDYLEGTEIRLSTFDYWRQRVLKSSQTDLPMVKIPVTKTVGSKAALILKIGDRYTIEIGDSFKPSTLQALLEVLK